MRFEVKGESLRGSRTEKGEKVTASHLRKGLQQCVSRVLENPMVQPCTPASQVKSDHCSYGKNLDHADTRHMRAFVGLPAVPKREGEASEEVADGGNTQVRRQPISTDQIHFIVLTCCFGRHVECCAVVIDQKSLDS